MTSQIVCAQCGIRYSGTIESCPWCAEPNPAGPTARARAAHSLSAPPATAGAAAPPGVPARPSPQDDPAFSELKAVLFAPDDPVAEPDPPPPSPKTPDGPPVPVDEPPAFLAPEPAPGAAQAADGAPAWIDPGGAAQSASRPAAARTAVQPAALAPHPQPQPEPVTPSVADPDDSPFFSDRPPPPPPRGRMRRVLGYLLAVIVLLAIGALIAEYAPLGSSGGVPTPPTGAEEPVDNAPIVVTTLPPTTAEPPPATTAAPATTAPGTTLAGPPVIEPIGDPIAIDDLKTGVDGIGELALGSDGDQIIGRLVATFGQPNEDRGVAASNGEYGTCSGDLIRVVFFGSLLVINQVDDAGVEAFAAYRLDLDYSTVPSPADGISTLSGLRMGDTVADLQATYSNFEVNLVNAGAQASYEVFRASDNRLLLQGPLTDVSPSGKVRGIYSPDACGA